MRIRLLAVVAVVSASLFGAVAPAVAHDQLVSSTPENGQLLDTAPAEITLTFTEPVLDSGMGSAIVVLDANGTDWVAGPLTVNDTAVNAPLKSDLPNGVYTVEWRVVSADGHPISAGFVFGVGSGQTLVDELAVAAAAVAPPADDDAAGESEAAEPLVTAEARTADAADAGQTITTAVVGGLLALALFAGGVFAIRRARATAAPPKDGENE